MLKRYIEAGQIVTTHGVMGEVKVYPWCDGPEFFAKLKKVYLDAQGNQSLTILSARTQKNMALLKFKEIEGMDNVRPLLEKTIYIDRNEANLPKDRYFVQDIIGLEVRDDKTSQVYGQITDVTHPAAIDIYEIKKTDGEKVLFPAVAEFLGEICPQQGYITVKPIEGMFNECESI